jgi:hypothetical protein
MTDPQSQHDSRCSYWINNVDCSCRTLQRWDAMQADRDKDQPPGSLEADVVNEKVARRHGVKLDAGKPQIWTGVIEQFPNALEEVAIITIEGTREEGHVLGGWRTVVDGYRRYSDAMARHMLAEAQIGIDDPKMGGDHFHRLKIKAAATVVWNDLARLEHLIADAAE